MALSLHPWVALVALGVLLRGGDGEPAPQLISVENGGNWGDWGDPEFCPKGSYGTGFQLKVEPPRGYFGDDTGLNGIRLLCNTGEVATSSEGHRGKWLSPLTCPQGRRLVSFRLRVEEPRGLWDDTAANNLDVACAGGTVLEGDGGRAGAWGNWSESCPLPQGVCGLQTRVEPPQRGGDDTGLNSVKFFCCP